MIRSARIEGLFDKKESIVLKVEGALFILTGDNGSGKTTILNMIFNALNGNYEWFLNKSFKEMEIVFDENKKKLKKLILSKTPKGIDILFLLEIKTYQIHVEKVNTPSIEYPYRFSYLCKKPYEEEENNFFWDDLYEELEMLIRRYRELGFINEIRESLLYFPTYRRIDADIKNLLDSSFQRSGSYSMREWSNAFNNNIHDFSRDRRVIGVGDEDIEKIYNVYSDELRQFNSEGLNELLKEFIKKVITSLYEDNTSHNMMNTKRNSNKKKNVYQTDPKHLLELAEKLGLDNINKEKVTQYYENKREFQKNLPSVLDETNVEVSIKSNGEILDDVKPRLFIEVLNNLLISSGNENTFVNELTRLYSKHLSEQEKRLKPYNYLKESFYEFFKEKFIIDFNTQNYKFTFSKSFSKLSTGEKQLITLFSYIGLTLKNTSFKSLIIIDEPELSLHISWQNKLMSQLLKNENAKFLIATHSPYIAKIEYFHNVHQLGEIDDY